MMEPTSSPREVQVAVHNVMLDLQRDLIRAAGTKGEDGKPLITPAEQQAYGSMARNALWRSAIGGASSAALTNFLVARATGPLGNVLRRKLVRFPAVMGSLMVGATLASNFGVRDQMVAAMSLPDEESPVGARARVRLIRQAPNSETLRLIRAHMSREGVAMTETSTDAAAASTAGTPNGQRTSAAHARGAGPSTAPRHSGSTEKGLGAAWDASAGVNTGIVQRDAHDAHDGGGQYGRSSVGSVGGSDGSAWGASAGASDGAYGYGTGSDAMYGRGDGRNPRDDFAPQSSGSEDAFGSAASPGFGGQHLPFGNDAAQA